MQKRFLPMLFAALVLPAALLQAQAPQPDPKDPQYQAKGDQKRTYAFPGTGEMIPYHLYVPMKWNKNTKLPLVIVTHGAGQPSDAPFQRPRTQQRACVLPQPAAPRSHCAGTVALVRLRCPRAAEEWLASFM